MPERFYAEIPDGALGPLLDLVGAPAERTLSPRLEMGAPLRLSEGTLRSLVRRGILTRPEQDRDALRPGFVAAAEVLLDPRVTLTLRLLTPIEDVTTRVHFPGEARLGGGVALNRVDRDELRMRAFVSADGLGELVKAGFITEISEAAPRSFQALFDAEVAAAFFGTSDLLRERAREGPDPDDDSRFSGVTGDELRRFLESAGERPRPERLSTCALLAMDRGTAATVEGAERGLHRLEAAGLVERRDSAYAPLGDLAALSRPDLGVAAAVHWHRLSFFPEDGDAAEIESRVFALLATDLLMSLDATEEGLLVRFPGADEVANFIHDRTGTASGAGPEDGSAPPAPDVGSGAGAEGERGPESTGSTGFCTRCGAELRPSASFCTQCRHPVRRRR